MLIDSARLAGQQSSQDHPSPSRGLGLQPALPGSQSWCWEEEVGSCACRTQQPCPLSHLPSPQLSWVLHVKLLLPLRENDSANSRSPRAVFSQIPLLSKMPKSLKWRPNTKKSRCLSSSLQLLPLVVPALTYFIPAISY